MRSPLSVLPQCNYVYFVRRALLQAGDLEDEAVKILAARRDNRALLPLRLREDLLMDDVAIAEFERAFRAFLPGAAAALLAAVPMRQLVTVESLLDAVLDKLDYRARLDVTCASEIAMLQRGLALRERAVAARDRPVAEEGGFSVATFNVNFFLGRRPACPSTAVVLDTVRRHAANVDIVLLQETHDQFTRLLGDALERSHPYCVVTNSASDAGGSAVFSRLPIDHVGTVNPAGIPGAMFPTQLYRLYAWGEPVWIANLHLRPPIEEGGGGGPFSMLATAPTRLAEIKAVLERLGDRAGRRIVLAGDWNENDGMPALAHCVLELGFDDALGMTDQFTHWWRLPGPEPQYTVRKRLDHVVVCGMRIDECSVVDEGESGSDHLMVVAKMNVL